jgi:RNA polymerase sigma-70 factor (ECF subfamily)
MARVAADGDREAFGRLVDRYKDPLVAYLARLSGCPERAQDLAQESFLRLYGHADRYRDQGQLKAYLFRIATNLLRSQERRTRRWKVLSTLLPKPGSLGSGDAGAAASAPEQVATHGWMLGSSADDGETRALRSEQRRLLTRAIAALPLAYRTVLVLSEIEEMPQRDIAALLGCREGTVKSRLHRARRKLQETLAPYWRSNETAAGAGREEAS